MIALALLACLLPVAAFAETIEIEAETGALSGTVVSSAGSGYSATGYVDGFDASGDKVTVTFDVDTSSSFNLVILYRAESYKEQYLLVDGESVGTIQFPATSGFESRDAGGIYLDAGQHTLSIESHWGYMQVDKFELTSVPPHDYTVTQGLIDPQADAATVGLHEYLKSTYGTKVISGQVAYWDELIAIAGHEPRLRAFDFQHYSQGYSYLWDSQVGGHVFGWHDNGVTEEAIAWYESTDGCGIVSFQWHWHSPAGGTISTNTFSTVNTTFSVTEAVNATTAEYDLIIEDIDSIATQLKKLQSAGVPVLWRPLHEAGGGWFWWGAEGAAACLQLWDIMYDRLTNHHGIHNLIWVWSTPEEDWYPGNGKVDIFGYDSYPGDHNYATQKPMFDQLYRICGGEKIVAMTENGPIPDVTAMAEQDAMWAYFASWDALVASQNSHQHIQDVFASPLVVTLDDGSCSATRSERNSLVPASCPAAAPGVDCVRLSSRQEYRIVGLCGRVVEQGRGDRVDLTGLPAGIYLLELQRTALKVRAR